MRLAVLAAPLALAVGASLPADAAAALTGAQEIAFLNAQRAANGLPADITEEPSWSDGCAKHMNYLALNHVFQHTEDATKPGYTPEGEDAGGHSVLTSGGQSFSATGVNAFEHAPIHLMQMLDPFLLRSGAAGGCLYTLGDVSRVLPQAQTFSYPGDGAVVPTSEVAFEGPFVPGAFIGLTQPNDVSRGLRTGPSLYFFYAAGGADGYWRSRGTITAASLTGPAGPVEVRWVDDSTTSPTLGDLGPYLAPGGIVIPVAPLADNATYTASVTFQPDGEDAPVVRTWTIRTGTGTPTPTPTPAPAGPGGSVIATATVSGTPVQDPQDTVDAHPITSLRLSGRAVTFAGLANAAYHVTLERATGSKAARWTRRRGFTITADGDGYARLALTRRPRAGRYRLRVRVAATGRLLASRTVRIH